MLLGLTNHALDGLFRDSPPAPFPTATCAGTVLAWPGTRLAKLLAALIYLIAWQGKVVNRRESLLRNKITPLHLRLIKAKLSHDDSWVDQRECVLLDYSRTSWVARMVRDELRLVGPELYLGVVWLWRRRVGWFTLRSPGVERGLRLACGDGRQVPVTGSLHSIAVGQVAAVTEVLSTQGAGGAGGRLCRFADLPGSSLRPDVRARNGHPAIRQTVPASLVYMADVDGSVDRHLRALVENAAAGVDKLFGSCVGYPGRPRQRAAYRLAAGHTR